MNITSSYQVRIVNCSVNLIDTVRIYQEALSYLIGVVSENWDAVKSITTGALEQQRYIEKLVHGNKNREAKYQESLMTVGVRSLLINLEPSPDCHFSRCQSMPLLVTTSTSHTFDFGGISANTNSG